MILKTRGRKIEIFSVDEFIEFLNENNYEYTNEDVINYFSVNRINEIQLSKLPFKKIKKVISEKSTKKSTKKSKNKLQEFIEKSGCPQKVIEYLKNEQNIIKAFSQPPMKFQEKVLYYGYLKDYNYYFLVIQNEFNYFKNFNYEKYD